MKEERKLKVLKEGQGIDLYSLDEVLWQQNLFVTRLREENQSLRNKIGFLTNCLDDRDNSIELLKEKNKKLKEKVKEAYQKGLEQGYKDQ